MIEHKISIYPNGGTKGEISVRQGDNLAHKLIFEIPAQVLQAGSTSARLKILPSGAKAPYAYPCVISGGTASCTPTYEAWFWPGTAWVQLEIYSGDVVLWQTVRIPVNVQGSIDDTGAATPEEGQALVLQLQEALSQAEEALSQADELLDFGVEAEALPSGSEPTVERIIDGTGKNTIAFGLPAGPIGPPGPQGKPGTGLRILGTYATLGDLRASVVEANQGDVYNVGTEAPYNTYMWEQSVPDWINLGQLGVFEAVYADEILTIALRRSVADETLTL